MESNTKDTKVKGLRIGLTMGSKPFDQSSLANELIQISIQELVAISLPF
jgi:hypothetical protein